MRFLALCMMLPLTAMAANANPSAADELQAYCTKNGGEVESMSVEYQDLNGARVEGFTKDFCSFNIDNGLIAVGLETFSSEKSNIAATLIKKLDPLEEDSVLWQGSYNNPSLNVCKNLGGSEVVFNVSSGGFADEKGESDICVFGDGSMVSAWSLIYMANGRTGYDQVKNAVKSEPINMNIPGSSTQKTSDKAALP
jgi:putative hemolysin